MSEKHLALMASTVALVLAAMSATALIMVNSVRTDLEAKQTAYGRQADEIAQLRAVVTQLKDNQLAMLPLLDPAHRSAAGPSVSSEVEDKTESATAGEDSQAAAAESQSGTVSTDSNDQHDVKQETPSSPAPAPEPQRVAPVAVAKPIPLGPPAPTPAGVKIFPAIDNQFVAPAPARETGAPQAGLTKPEDTILAALQTPTMGMKQYPVLDQIKEVSYTEPAQPAPPPKKLENVDSILVGRIIANWKRPASARNGMAVEILIKMSRDGSVRSASVVSSSGDKGFDTSATAAILAVKEVPEMTQVSDATYKHFYKERRVRFSPEDLSG